MASIALFVALLAWGTERPASDDHRAPTAGQFYRSAEVSELRTWVWAEGEQAVGWGGLAHTYQRCLLGYTDDPAIPPIEGPCTWQNRAPITGSVGRALAQRVRDDRQWFPWLGEEPRAIGTLGEGRLIEVTEGRALWPEGGQWMNDVARVAFLVTERGWIPVTVRKGPRERCDGACVVDDGSQGLERTAAWPALSSGISGGLGTGHDAVGPLRSAILGDVEGALPARRAEVDCPRRYEVEEVAVSLLEVELAALQASSKQRRAGDELAQRLACATPRLSRGTKARALRSIGMTRPDDEAIAWWSAARVFDAGTFAMLPTQAPRRVRMAWQEHAVVDWGHLPLAVAVTDTDIPQDPE